MRGPGEVDFFDQISESLSLELRKVQSALGSHGEHQVERLDSQAIHLFTILLSLRMADLLSEDTLPSILQVPSIWYNHSWAQQSKTTS